MALRRRALEDVGLDLSFWGGRRVLVTGHTGFKGAWLCLWLKELGADTTGLSLEPPTQPSLFDEARVGEGMDDHRGDIRDRDGVRAAVAGAEVVIHMAAQPLVRRSYEDPHGTFETNVMGTANVLDALRAAAGVRVALVITSDKCYEPRADGAPCREGDPLGGADPYAASKACAELVTAAHRRSFPGGPAIASARAGNVIGGGDWAVDRLVPDAMRAAADGGELVVRNPDAVRPWQHVLNPLSGYLELVERLWDDRSAAGAWNLGPDPGDELPVRAIADRICELWGEGLAWRAEGDGGPPETALLRLDSTKACEQLGWSPAWDLDEALAATVDWHRAHAGGADVGELCARQIADYAAARTRKKRPNVSMT
ncbi:MAG: CDP-glucose 4,6-dehydratase [Thermoleophilaceae bacterium]|nr:CDP-glucose 4,6-dehydratase [Thermoleophilaceae bacterium]